MFKNQYSILLVAALMTSSISFAAESIPEKESALAHTDLAYAYFQGNNVKVAKEELQKALDVNPKFFNALLLSGVIASQEQDYNQASKWFDKALKIKPNDPDLLNNYGMNLCQMHQYEEAQQNFDKIFNLNDYSGKSSTYVNSGLCYLEQKKYDLAADQFKKARIVDPQNGTAYYQMANLYYQMANYSRSIDSLNDFHSRFKPNASSLFLQWMLYKDLNQMDMADQIAQLIRTKFPTSPQAKKIAQNP